MTTSNPRPFVVSVEGNIGSGKSTLLKHFDRFHNVQLLPEPVDEWCDLGGNNLLEKLYEDPKRWSFQFQSFIQLTRLRLLRSPTDKKVKLLERSIQNNRYCFLELAKRNGSLSGPELAVLYSWFDWLDENMGLDLDLIVYLKTCPVVAFNRMQERGRKEETGSVPLEYLKSLHNAYEDWLVHQSFGKLNVPVLVIDANRDMEDMIQTYKELHDEICGNKPISVELQNNGTTDSPTVKC